MLQLINLHKSFDHQPVLRGVNVTVTPGEIVCLLGASGSGKSTLLRIVAGLDAPDHGRVLWNGQDLGGVPVHRRGFGLMFQDYALFPHRNVAENVAFGLRMQGQSRAEQTRRVQEVLALVGLGGFEQRDVNLLSGGERQRVALARSLAPHPSLLMLDEPLGSLDRSLRERLQIDLRVLLKQLGLMTLYVTHDQAEAFALGDRLALLHAGQVEQAGTPQQLYRQPETAFVARFLGLNNLAPAQPLPGPCAQTAFGHFRLATADNLPVPTSADAYTLLLRPDAATLLPEPPRELLNTVTGHLVSTTFRGVNTLIGVQTNDGTRLHFDLDGAIPLPALGSPVWLQIDPRGVRWVKG